MNHEQIDAVTREVISGWLDTVAEEMQTTLVKTSHSPIITDGGDATAALFDRAGRTLAQASAVPVHLGVLAELGKRFASTYPSGEALAGDVYVTNDPYAGGTHMPDIAIAMPVFHEQTLVGYVATMSHHRDIGGLAPASVSVRARDIHAEGLRLPMIRLARGGRTNPSISAVIEANSRTPHSLRGDLGAQIAACRTGASRYAELFERWPAEVIEAASDALLDYAEKMTRHEIASIPDGDYPFSDQLDDDGLSPDSGPVTIAVTMSVRDSDIIFDFDGTAPQVRGAINNVPASTRAIVYYGVRLLTGDRVPNNDGCYRPITVRLPEGSIVNSSYPAPVASRGVSLQRIEDVVLGAMAKALPDRMTAAHSGQYTLIGAAGPDPDGDGLLIGHFGGPFAGGHGARPTKDGIDVNSHGAANGSAIPVEIAESRLPIRFHRLELWQDSGGAGKWRGGLGYRAEVEWLRGETIVTLRRERVRFGPWGIQGGGGAPPSRAEMLRADGSTSILPGKIEVQMSAGDCLCYWTTGSGGYGPAQERDPARVLDDVLDGRVSVTAAEDAYGVVIRGGSIDDAATGSLRKGDRGTEPPTAREAEA